MEDMREIIFDQCNALYMTELSLNDLAQDKNPHK